MAKSPQPYIPFSQSCLLEELPGLNEETRIRFSSCGIQTTGELLQKTSTPSLKQELIQQLQLSPQVVNKWIAMADLARLKSVGCQYCGLLLHAGIASVTQLAVTPAGRLHKQILRLQVATLQRRDLCPSVGDVQKWIREARSLSQLR